MHYRGIQEGTGCKDYRPTIRKKAVSRSVWGMGTISKRGREKQAVRDTPGGLRIVYGLGAISGKDTKSSIQRCQIITGRRMEKAVQKATVNWEVNNCVYNWTSDRKTGRFATANEVKSVTSHEVININACFPHAERNAMKKQLVINTLSFEVHTEVYDGYGDMEMADCRFTIDRKSRVLTMTDFHTGGMEQSVTLEGGQMAKLLRYIVHTLEIFMWEQDYSLRPDAEDYDPFLDGEEGFFKEDLEDRLEIQPPKEPEGSPSWRVQVEYTNHTEQDVCGYEDYLPDRPEELYLSLLEYFEPEDEVF